MRVDTENIFPVTELQKKLTRKIRDVSESGEPVYVMKNNAIKAVIISVEEYETLRDMEEVLEHLEIAEMVANRLAGHSRSKNISWEKIKEKYGL